MESVVDPAHFRHLFERKTLFYLFRRGVLSLYGITIVHSDYEQRGPDQTPYSRVSMHKIREICAPCSGRTTPHR